MQRRYILGTAVLYGAACTPQVYTPASSAAFWSGGLAWLKIESHDPGNLPLGLTVGALPSRVQVLALESSKDVVPHLDGRANPDLRPGL